MPKHTIKQNRAIIAKKETIPKHGTITNNTVQEGGKGLRKKMGETEMCLMKRKLIMNVNKLLINGLPLLE